MIIGQAPGPSTDHRALAPVAFPRKYPPPIPLGAANSAGGLSTMNTTRIVGWLAAAVLVSAIYILMTSMSWAQTFRDASGKITGTATKDSNGTTTFRDGSGRQTGTATTNSNGTTTFRDGSGGMTGTEERLPRPTTCAIAQHCMDSNGKWK